MADENKRHDITEQFLDVLLDALIERNNERKRVGYSSARKAETNTAQASTETSIGGQAAVALTNRMAVSARAAGPGEAGWIPAPAATSIGVGRTLWRLLLLVVILAVVINIPVTSHGVSLARLLPDREALIIRDGLLLKTEGDAIYVLMDNELHWIPTISAFGKMGYRWDDVHVVDEDFMSQFVMGDPMPQLIKCEDEPHVYRVNADGTRSWIVDINTFVAEGYVWDDVMELPCDEVEVIPLGESIPAGNGAPPNQ